MTELEAAERRRLHKRQFAYVDGDGVGHLPIHDAAHVRNAVSRWSQTSFPSRAARERARKAILAAARLHRIDVSDDDRIAKSDGT